MVSGPNPATAGMVNSSGILNSSGYTRSPHSEDIENHQRHAHADRRISHVERPEVPVAIVRIDEIQHVPVGDAVDEVAGGAANDQRQSKAAQTLTDVERCGVQRK